MLQKGNRGFSRELKSLLLRITNQGNASLADIDRAHWLLGRTLLSVPPLLRHSVDMAVFSGHTLHHVEQAGRSGLGTFQIGAVEPLALKLGKPVVTDMRYTDVAAGGMGAPLVPAADSIMFPEGAVVLNIGGISNITLIDREVTGFDCGPGNMLIDGAMKILYGRSMDRNGTVAKSGTVNQHLLSFLMRDEFVNSRPPKSTGRERYSVAYLNSILTKARKYGMTRRDIIATLSAFTSDSILSNIVRFAGGRETLIVAGGGAYNSYILERLRSGFRGSVMTSSAYGVDPDTREAVAFAILCYLSVNLKPANSRATGAKTLLPLGRITLYGFSRKPAVCL